ncbi:ATP-grasp domain-containing protein [Tsukamurella serpentis]
MTVACIEMLSFGLGRIARAARTRGEDLVLVTAHPDLYVHEISANPEAFSVIGADTADPDAVERALRDVADLRGVINMTDTFGAVACEVAQRLGLASPTPQRFRELNDKAHVRNLLHRAGLSSEGARVIEVGQAPSELGQGEGLDFPVVVKDRSGTASKHVWVLRSAADLDHHLLAITAANRSVPVIVERYLAGPVYSAETLTVRGTTHLLGVSSRLMSPLPQMRETATAFPTELPADLESTVEKWITQVVDTLGITDQYAHIEFVLTAAGPDLIEVNNRIGGALVGESLAVAFGDQVYDPMIDLALGTEPDLSFLKRREGPASAFILCYPAAPGRFTGTAGVDRLGGFPGRLRYYPTKSPGTPIEGDHLVDGRGCVGILVAHAETAELALQYCWAGAGFLEMSTEQDGGVQ